MSLTTGRGPLSRNRSGRFTAPVPEGVVYVEPFRRRVRGVIGSDTVVETEQALLVHRAGEAPAYAFPMDAVRSSSVRVTPEPAAPGYVQVAWDAVEHWYEEEEEVHMHPRNPYHRVDCVPTTRRLRVRSGDTVLVDADETIGVYETALEPRLYARPDQVRMDLLSPSPTTTYCPYKGTASYWNLTVDYSVVPDVAWSYEDPLPESRLIAGMLGFDPDKVEVLQDLPDPASF